MPDRPQLHAPIFGTDPYGQWARLARVLRVTAARHCSDWDVHIKRIQPPTMRSVRSNESHVANTQKMQYWHELVAAAPDGARLLLIDADTMILRPLLDLWAQPFDFAYTTKASHFPFNSGVIAVRVSDPVRRFFTVWLEENRRMLGDQIYHQVWRKKYGGINQAALGLVLERGDHRGLQMCELPCVEWNCEDASWDSFNPAVTRIVHLKSALRQFIFFRHPGKPSVQRLAKIWKALEQQALVAEAAPAGAASGAATAATTIGTIPGGARPRRTTATRVAIGQTSATPVNRFGAPALRPGRPAAVDGPSVRVNPRVAADVYDVYCRRALAEGVSVNTLLRRAIENHNI